MPSFFHPINLAKDSLNFCSVLAEYADFLAYFFVTTMSLDVNIGEISTSSHPQGFFVCLFGFWFFLVRTASFGKSWV